MAIEPRQMISDWFDKSAEAMDAAVKTTAKFQEESILLWTGMMGGGGSIHDWQTHAQALAAGAIPAAQKSELEYVHAVKQTCSRALDLLEHACKSGEGGSIQDLQARTQALQTEAMDAIRANNQAFIEAGTKAMESWAELACKAGEVKPATPVG